MKYTIIITILTACLSACSNLEENINKSKPVLEAYMYANQNRVDIKVTDMADFSEVGKELLIDNADIKILKDGEYFQLQHDDNNLGHYVYEGNKPIMEEGDIFGIKMVYNGNVVEGNTVIPQKPEGVSLSKTSISVSPINTISKFEQLKDLKFSVNWINDDNSYYFVTIENISENPKSIFDLHKNVEFNFSLITKPTIDDSYEFNIADINQFGTYKVTVFRVNSEYVDLYNSIKQDSRNLNEPLTNLIGGYGLFTAFNSVENYFEIIAK